MRTAKITDKLTVAAQPSLTAFAALPQAGFAAVINNRPDGEDAAQPGTAAEAAAAQGAGLGYTHIPVTGPTITEADVRTFQAALASADGPVLAHCKGGTRALTLYVIGEVLDGRMAIQDVRGFGETHGFDLAGAEAWLRRREGTEGQS